MTHQSHAGRKPLAPRAGSRQRSFWVLQIGGWATYAALKGLAFPLATADLVWVAVKGIVLTCFLREAYAWMERRSAPFVLQLPVAFAASLAVTAVSLWLSTVASDAGWLLTGPGVRDWITSPRGFLHDGLLYGGWSALYLSLRTALTLRQEQRRLHRALGVAQQSQADLLRSQVNPHFLFNALASVRATIVKDPGNARLMVGDLAEFLRYSLQMRRDEAPLGEELEAVERYLAIHELRFGDRLEWALHADDGVQHVRTASFVLMPLVENAIKYGRLTGPSRLRIEVSATWQESDLRLAVLNTGRWVDAEESLGSVERNFVGLENLEARLREQREEHFELRVSSPDDDHVLVEVLLHGVRPAAGLASA